MDSHLKVETLPEEAPIAVDIQQVLQQQQTNVKVVGTANGTYVGIQTRQVSVVKGVITSSSEEVPNAVAMEQAVNKVVQQQQQTNVKVVGMTNGTHVGYQTRKFTIERASSEEGPNAVAMQPVVQQQQQANVEFVGMTNGTHVGLHTRQLTVVKGVASSEEAPNAVAMQQVVQQQQTDVVVEHNDVNRDVNRDVNHDKSDLWIVYIALFAIAIIAAIIYLVFIVCKFLVKWMIIEENIDVNYKKPISDSINCPVLDLSLRFLYYLSTRFEKLTSVIKDNLVIIFYIRVMISQAFDLVVILYLNIVAPITVYWVLYMLFDIAFCTVITVSVILNFCCRNILDSDCKRLDVINNFKMLFLLFKLFSFVSSVILLINELDFNARFGSDSLVAFFIFVTVLDLWFLVLTFIAMIVQYITHQTAVSDIQQTQQSK